MKHSSTINSNQTVIPESLKPGDVIGIAAPAGAFDAERFQQGLNVLETMGFKTVIPEGLFIKQRYLAGSDGHRAEILNRLFSDSTIKAIMCARGGFGSLKVLPILDFDLIRENPKIFAGFSDISILLSVIFEKTGLVAFHAPVITALADAGQQTTAAMNSVFTSVAPTLLTIKTGITITPGRAAGVVRGGNLASLCQLAGTPYQPDLRVSLLLLEDVNEAPYRIDRMLSQMRLSGCLEGVVGVLLGRFERCGDVGEIHEIVKNTFPDKVPVLAGLPVGHAGENLSLPLGLTATLDADNALLQYDSSPVTSGDGK